MAKNRQPIAKHAKALGISPATMGYFKKETTRNSNNQTRKKKSEYATQLQEKQKVKFIYGVLEKQFRGYYEKAERMTGKTGEMVNHGHFTINGKKVNIPSYQVKPGMVVALKESSRSIERFKMNLENNAYHVIPKWLEFDAANMIGKVVAAPTREDIDFPVEERLIVELYSK